MNRKTEIDMEKDRDRQTDGQINREIKGNIDRE